MGRYVVPFLHSLAPPPKLSLVPSLSSLSTCGLTLWDSCFCTAFWSYLNVWNEPSSFYSDTKLICNKVNGRQGSPTCFSSRLTPVLPYHRRACYVWKYPSSKLPNTLHPSTRVVASSQGVVTVHLLRMGFCRAS